MLHRQSLLTSLGYDCMHDSMQDANEAAAYNDIQPASSTSAGRRAHQPWGRVADQQVQGGVVDQQSQGGVAAQESVTHPRRGALTTQWAQSSLQSFRFHDLDHSRDSPPILFPTSFATAEFARQRLPEASPAAEVRGLQKTNSVGPASEVQGCIGGRPASLAADQQGLQQTNSGGPASEVQGCIQGSPASLAADQQELQLTDSVGHASEVQGFIQGSPANPTAGQQGLLQIGPASPTAGQQGRAGEGWHARGDPALCEASGLPANSPFILHVAHHLR